MKDKTRLQKNVFSTHKIIILVELIFLAIIANHYQIALYLIFFLLPIYLAKNFNLDSIFRIFILIGTWIIFNTFLLSKQTDVSINTPFFFSNILNILIIVWINIICYFCFFYKILKTSEKVISFQTLLIIIVLCLIETVCFWEKRFSSYVFPFIAISVFSTFLYTYLLMKCCSKKECLYINLLISISPIITFISACISIFFILNTFNVQNDFRPVYLYGFDYLIFFQIISLSSIIFYFIPANKFNKSGKIGKIISLIGVLIFISLGVILQTKYGRFLDF